MALDQAYFDAIQIEVVKKKYYNAKKVDAVLEDVRRQALALSDENGQLAAQLYALNERKSEIGDALLSAQTIAQQIIQDAQVRAGEILAEAGKQARALTEEAEQRSRTLDEETAERRQALSRTLTETEQRLRERIALCLDEVSEELHALPALLDADDAEPDIEVEWESLPDEAEDGEPPVSEEAEDTPAPADGLPAGLNDKLDAIARDMFALDEDTDDEDDEIDDV